MAVPIQGSETILKCPPEVSEIPWMHPCTGRYENTLTSSETIRPYLEVLEHYLKAIKLEVKLEAHYKPEDIEEWKLYKYVYAKLPELKSKSKLNLITWHRYIQIYIAVISHLKEEQTSQNYGNPKISTHLKDLRYLSNNSKRLLCEIESAVKTTLTNPNLEYYTAEEMDEELDYMKTNGRHEVSIYFVKHYYYRIISNMVTATCLAIHKNNITVV